MPSNFSYRTGKRSKVSKRRLSPIRSPRALKSFVAPSFELTTNVLVWTVPIFLKSPNAQVNPWAQGKINFKIGQSLLVYMPKEMKYVTLPCKITFTRIAPRKLDYDNLVFGFKYVRDFICGHLKPGLAAGRADGDSRFTFDYSQESAGKGEYGIKITFENL